MARTPRVQPNTVISNFTSPQIPAGEGWAALADAAGFIGEVVRPAAIQAAREQGAQATYRDENGVLRVDEKSLLGGEMAAEHNAAAHAAYLGEFSVDLRDNLNELANENEFDPGAFRESAKAYVDMATKGAPASLRQDVRLKADAESGNIFNRLYRGQVERHRDASDRQSQAARKMAAEDAISLFQMNGDSPEFRAKLAEIDSITRFRTNAPWIEESEAEGEAFFDAVMGDAKAASLRRTLEDISGEGSISDEDRKELESAVQDMDLSPQTRDQLYGLLNGTLKTIDARQIVDGMTADDFWSRLTFVESGGDPRARPTDPETGELRSSASGRFQITDGTFVGAVKTMRRQGAADWAKGLSDDQILARKGDATVERAAAETIREGNREALQAANVPVTSGTEYLAWFLGSGDAVKVLRASPNTPISEVVKPGSIEANPEVLGGRTAGEVVNWARRKMRVKSSDIAGMNERLDAIEDFEVRGKASALLNQWYGKTRQGEVEAAEEYRLRLASGEDVTSNEILSDPRLDDNDQATLLNTLNSAQSEQMQIQQTLSKLNDPGATWNAYDTSERNDVDKVFSALTDGMDPLGPESQAIASQMAERTGYIPKTAFNAVRGALLSQDPERVAAGMGFVEQVFRKNPGAFRAYDGSNSVEKAIAEFRHHARLGRSGEEAAERMIAARDPEQMERRRNRSAEAGRLAGQLTESQLIAAFDDSVFNDPALPRQQASLDRMMSTFRREYESAFIESADEEVAKAQAIASVKRVYGVSRLTGEPRLMRLPPENFYPAVNGGHDWLRDQLVGDVNLWRFGEAAGVESRSELRELLASVPPTSFFMSGEGEADMIRTEDIFLAADDETQMDVSAGRPPSYRVFYEQDGKLEEVGQRFFGDPRNAHAIRDERAREATEREQESFSNRAREAREFLRESAKTMSMKDAVDLTKKTYPEMFPDAVPPIQ